MISTYRSISWFRVAILVWTCTWMLAVPLFHIHPDADHRHGEAGHVHGGTVHTVLSQDLDCEHSSQQAMRGSGQTVRGDVSVSAHQSHPLNEHPEFGISLLSDPTDRKSFKPCSTPVLAIMSVFASGPELHRWVQHSSVPVRASTLPAHDVESRAPPFLFV
jgi:hypothetical protein